MYSNGMLKCVFGLYVRVFQCLRMLDIVKHYRDMRHIFNSLYRRGSEPPH